MIIFLSDISVKPKLKVEKYLRWKEQISNYQRISKPSSIGVLYLLLCWGHQQILEKNRREITRNKYSVNIILFSIINIFSIHRKCITASYANVKHFPSSFPILPYLSGKIFKLKRTIRFLTQWILQGIFCYPEYSVLHGEQHFKVKAKWRIWCRRKETRGEIMRVL